MLAPLQEMIGRPAKLPVEWIIWDWNGTLLDDTVAALNALNAQLVRRGLSAITLEFYRANFSFPAKPFYAFCGIDLAREDWDRLAREYHEAYRREPKALNREAITVLEHARRAGIRQCVLSALRQDLLEAALAETGIRDYFEFVYGTDNLDGGSKLARGRELVERLRAADDGFSSRSAVMIGDALHDAEVAAELGVRCVLTAQGGHSAVRLRAVAPTGETLRDALRLALG